MFIHVHKLGFKYHEHCIYTKTEKMLGLVRDLNPGPLAPKARIIPLDQRAVIVMLNISM